MADIILEKYAVISWSFDKGYWAKDNKHLLQLFIPQVVMPKLGKKTIRKQKKSPAKALRSIKIYTVPLNLILMNYNTEV